MRWRCRSACSFSRVQFTADLMPSATWSASASTSAARRPSSSTPARCSRRCCWPTRSTAPARRRRARCSRRWRSTRSRSRARRARCRAPFFVIATQNPTDQLGTYPLPESQLDRFLMCITLGYPDRASERALLAGADRREAIERLRPVMTPAELHRGAAGGAGGACRRAAARLPAGADRRDALGPLVRRGPVAARRHRGAARRQGARAARTAATTSRPTTCRRCCAQTIAHRLVPVAGAGRGAVEQVRAMVEVGGRCRERRACPALARSASRARLRAWWQARLPRTDTLDADPAQHLHPADARRAGCSPLTLVVLLVASINYQLNLGYLLTFLLAGSGARRRCT